MYEDRVPEQQFSERDLQADAAHLGPTLSITACVHLLSTTGFYSLGTDGEERKPMYVKGRAMAALSEVPLWGWAAANITLLLRMDHKPSGSLASDILGSYPNDPHSFKKQKQKPSFSVYS